MGGGSALTHTLSSLEAVGEGGKPSSMSMERAHRARLYGVDCLSELSWHGWEPGGEYQRSLLVKNVSSKTIKLRYQLPATKYFSLEFPEPIRLCPGMATSVVVTFRPVKRERYDDVVEFTTAAGAFEVPMRATLPVVALEVPPSVDFGYCPAKEPARRTFSFTNTGELTVDFSWKIGAPFTFEPATGRLAPGESQTVTATFSPEDASMFVANAVCMTDADNMFSVKVSGIGKYPYIRFHETDLDFGEVLCGQQAEHIVRLVNASIVPASYNLEWMDASRDGVFTVTPSRGVIQPNTFDEVKFVYTPAAAGMFSTETARALTLGGNAPTVSCRGTALSPAVTLSASSVNFGDLVAGASASRVLYLENSSAVPVPFQICAERKGTFKFDKTAGVVAPKSSTHVTVAFAPTEPSNYYRRVMFLIKDAAPIGLDVLGTCYNDRRRPPPFQQSHVDVYRRSCTGAAEQEGLTELESLPTPKLWEHLFGADPASGIQVDQSDVDFGACSRLRMSEYRQVTVKNTTTQKITCFWACPGAADNKTFHVFPDQGDIKPNGTMTFRVSFRPDRDDQYYSQQLECFAYVKTMRSFRLVTNDNLTPPWCTTVQAFGHTFIGGAEDFMPKVEFSAKRLVLPPCSKGQASYQTVALMNDGDTPVSFEFHEERRLAPFAVKPNHGVVAANSYQLLAVKMDGESVGAFNTKLICTLNNSKANTLELPLSGSAFVPKVTFNNDGSLYFKPTCVGATSARTVQVTNMSRIPVTFEWAIPPRLARTLHISPPAGVLRGAESVPVAITFVPQKQKTYSSRIPLVVRAVHDESDAPEGDRVLLAITGEGTVGAITVEPAALDFSTVVVGQTLTRQLTLLNQSDGNVSFTLECKPESEAAQQMDEEALVLDATSGVLPARGYVTVNVAFTPKQRASYTYELCCRSNTNLLGAEPVVEATEPVTIATSGVGAFPTLCVVDAVCSGTSKSVLWRTLNLNAVNAELASELTPAEEMLNESKRMLTIADLLEPLANQPVNFGVAPLGAATTTVRLMLSNPGVLAVEWNFMFRNDPEVEMENWVEVGEAPTEEDRRQTYIVENRVFDVQPRFGYLEPGGELELVLTYTHFDEGDHELPVLLSVNEGKRVRLCLHGRTVSTDAVLLDQPSPTHDLLPLPIGEAEPPLQTYALHNPTSEAVTYAMDTAPLEALSAENYGFPVLSVENETGIIPAGGVALVGLRFQPIESKSYEATLPISVEGGEGTSVTFRGDGYHPGAGSAPENVEADKTKWLGFRGRPLLGADGVAHLSLDCVSFGDVPALSVSRRLFLLSNVSGYLGCEFEWDIGAAAALEGKVTVEPMRGTLTPGGVMVCKVTFAAGTVPTLFDADLSCTVKPLEDDLPSSPLHPASTASGITMVPGLEEVMEVIAHDGMHLGGPVKPRDPRVRESVVNATTESTRARLPPPPPAEPEPEPVQPLPPAPTVLRLGVDGRVMTERQYKAAHGDYERHYVPLGELAAPATSLPAELPPELARNVIREALLDVTGAPEVKATFDRLTAEPAPFYAGYAAGPLPAAAAPSTVPAPQPPTLFPAAPPPAVLAAEPEREPEPEPEPEPAPEALTNADFPELAEWVLEATLYNIIREDVATGSLTGGAY